MSTIRRTSAFYWPARVGLAVLAAVTLMSVTACGHVMMMMPGTGAVPPPAGEFGLGPRTSTQRLYIAPLQRSQPLRPRQMQTVRVIVADARGRAIDGADISVDAQPEVMLWAAFSASGGIWCYAIAWIAISTRTCMPRSSCSSTSTSARACGPPLPLSAGWRIGALRRRQ